MLLHLYSCSTTNSIKTWAHSIHKKRFISFLWLHLRTAPILIEHQQLLKAKMSNGTVENSVNSFGMSLPRRLAAFDFDYTVVEQNSDTVIRNLLPREAITKDIDDLIDSAGWTRYMSEIFRLLHEHGISPERICNTVRGIPEVPGLVKCLKTLRQQNFDLIIISDSNSVFIDEWLKTHGLADCVDTIFTNPAEFQSNGVLTIQPHHHQTDCRLSAANLCKGKVLERFIMERNLREGVKYAQIIYAGDGNNDICPVLRLHPGDLACARSGFGMAKNLQKNSAKLKLRATLIHWQNGFDLLAKIQESLGERVQ